MNADTKEHGIEVSYDRQNIAIVKLSDYKKLKARLIEAERVMDGLREALDLDDYFHKEAIQAYEAYKQSIEDKSK